MNRLEKKVDSEYFEAILSGNKTFELRLADWKCAPGDVLILREWNPVKKEYSGRSLEKTITYVLKTKDLALFPEEDVEKFGYQILAFK